MGGTTCREQIIADLRGIAVYFRQRLDGASKDSQNRYWHMAEVADRAAQYVYSDGETIKEYEAELDKLEDDRK